MMLRRVDALSEVRGFTRVDSRDDLTLYQTHGVPVIGAVVAANDDDALLVPASAVVPMVPCWASALLEEWPRKGYRDEAGEIREAPLMSEELVRRVVWVAYMLPDDEAGNFVRACAAGLRLTGAEAVRQLLAEHERR